MSALKIDIDEHMAKYRKGPPPRPYANHQWIMSADEHMAVVAHWTIDRLDDANRLLERILAGERP